ncbi:MAG: hypothetical protein ACO4AI_11335, partial [Prochlorothrix sp.]
MRLGDSDRVRRPSESGKNQINVPMEAGPNGNKTQGKQGIGPPTEPPHPSVRHLAKVGPYQGVPP